MDDKNQQAVSPDQPTVPPAQAPPSVTQPDKSPLDISDKDAAAILAIHNLQAGE